ncbi:uncharacterized protein LOC129248346 [Anastrepha obliqua]|uniref:uncharacterized protein LOC129248346 n=1 Tax=Anastrepha obliqua TaxID=95512 RepID=UPI002409586E|nr:uncharacterized protein LOC129248346 [Anastrepha obliqua]
MKLTGILIFFGCTIIQLIESLPTDSSTSQDPSGSSNDYKNSDLANNNLDLTARHNILLEFEKHFAQLSREAVKEILADLQALPEHSDAIENNITALSHALEQIEDVNIIYEPLDNSDVRRVSNVIGDLINSNVAIANGAATHEKLAFEMHRLTDWFGEVFDDFIATLTPEEQQSETELINLHQQYKESDDEHKWELLPGVWNSLVI